jgi:hypothetical protein
MTATSEFVKVPFHVEADGKKTFFLPDCRLGVGYEIGKRGEADKEKHIQNYWDALEKLSRMSQPRFRRKNRDGIPGTVTCQHEDSEEVSRDFIEQERLKFGG